MTKIKLLNYKCSIFARKLYRFINSFRFYGDKYYCPFCKGNFSHLLPQGFDNNAILKYKIISAGYRNNSICPRCKSKDRERLIYLYLMKRKEELFSYQLKLLHVAPEENLSHYFRSNSNIDYTSADLNPSFEDVKMDITKIDKRNNTYDIVICNHVLEHVPDDTKAMKEIYRILKQGGFAILQVPISETLEYTVEDFSITTSEEREIVFGQHDHVRIYGKDYVSRLTQSGFNIEIISCKSLFNSDEINRYSLLENETIFLCNK